jgi:hypothetical protein
MAKIYITAVLINKAMLAFNPTALQTQTKSAHLTYMMNMNIMMMSNKEAFSMPSPQVGALNRDDIVRTARQFRWTRQMPKWTVIVEGRELPARPLVLQAASVPPNDPTNSHQAIAKLKSFNFDTRYEGKSV